MADTIFAVSTGRPPAAIAIVRISGPAVREVSVALGNPVPTPRQARVQHWRHRGEVLDRGIALFFPGPASATGEDLLELHCHGGRAVVAAIEQALGSLPGLRRAEPGEFTRRALLHGRIDLAQAQGLADLLAAETEAQRRAAMGAADGRISRVVAGWADAVARLSARAEAALDFAEEDDVADDAALTGRLHIEMRELACAIEGVLATPSVDRLRDGIHVVLGGPPNSGKSTLINLLAQRDVAIVSPRSGTTRDRVEASVTRDGLPFVLVDTAGLAADTDDAIEQIGIARAEEAITQADLLLWLGDLPPPRGDALWIHARADAPGRMPAQGTQLSTSAGEPQSIEALWCLIVARAAALIPGHDQLALAAEQQRLCHRACDALQRDWTDLLIGAEMLRTAHTALASILGQHATEQMLDSLFGQFCIGK